MKKIKTWHLPFIKGLKMVIFWLFVTVCTKWLKANAYQSKKEKIKMCMSKGTSSLAFTWGQIVVAVKQLNVHCRLHGNWMYCLLLQAFMVGHGRWSRGKSCLEGMINYVNYSSKHVIEITWVIQLYGVWAVILSLHNIAFHRQQKWGLNTYLYAPKDDYKHRMFWRELYSVEEAGDYTEHLFGSAGLGQGKWIIPSYLS